MLHFFADLFAYPKKILYLCSEFQKQRYKSTTMEASATMNVGFTYGQILSLVQQLSPQEKAMLSSELKGSTSPLFLMQDIHNRNVGQECSISEDEVVAICKDVRKSRYQAQLRHG